MEKDFRRISRRQYIGIINGTMMISDNDTIAMLEHSNVIHLSPYSGILKQQNKEIAMHSAI